MTTLYSVDEDGDNLWWSLQEVMRGCQLEAAFIVQCVEFGIAEASGVEPQWQFNATSRQRLLKAWRLHRDLDVHLSALPLVLDLLDEVESLHLEAERLRARLRHWEHTQ